MPAGPTRLQAGDQTLRLRILDVVVKPKLTRGLVASDPTAATLDVLRRTQNSMVRRALVLSEGEQKTWLQYREWRRRRIANGPEPREARAVGHGLGAALMAAMGPLGQQRRRALVTPTFGQAGRLWSMGSFSAKWTSSLSMLLNFCSLGSLRSAAA